MENRSEHSKFGGEPFVRAALVALSDIKLAHTVFALPFAVLAAFLAAPAPIDWSRFSTQLLLVLVCMVGARTWAMLVNRLADHRLDAANPRTAGRAIAAGRLRPGQGGAVAAVAAALFLGGCAGFLAFTGNAWPLILGVPVLAWIALYSFTKRFTWLAHAFLGGALAVSPVAAAIAVHPEALGLPMRPAGPWAAPSDAGWTILLLAGFVLPWVAGFDVLYALQDLEYDRSAGLHSIPARFGRRGAAWISRTLHAAALAVLIGANTPEARLGALFGVATGVVGALLVAEHVILARKGLAGLPMVFFTLNGVVSVLLGAAGVIDVLT